MRSDLKLRYQKTAYNYYNNHEAAYKALLELGDTPNQDACKKIAEEHKLKLEGVKNAHYLIRKLKSIGVPVNPPQPVIQVQKRRRERCRMDLETFKSKHTECYARLKRIMEDGLPMDKSTRRQLGKKYGLNRALVFSKFTQMKRHAKRDEEMQEYDDAHVEEDDDHEEQEDQEEQEAQEAQETEEQETEDEETEDGDCEEQDGDCEEQDSSSAELRSPESKASVQTQRTIVLEEQPLERADSETQSTMNNEIRVGTVEQQQQYERTRPLLETQLIEDHTSSRVILEPEEAVETQSMVHGAKGPEKQQNPETKYTTRIVSESEEKVGEQRMDLETQPTKDNQPQEVQDMQDGVLEHRPETQPLPLKSRNGSAQRGVESNPNDSLEFPGHPASSSSVKRYYPACPSDAPTAKRLQPEREDVDSTFQTVFRVLSEMTEHGNPRNDIGSSQMEGADNTKQCHNSMYIVINDALDILHNALNQLDDNSIKIIGKSLQVDLKEIIRMLNSSTIPEYSSRNEQYPASDAIIQDIKRCFLVLGSGICELPVECKDGMGNELKLDLSTIERMLENWNMNREEAIKEEQMDVQEEVQVKIECPDESMEQQHEGGTAADQAERQIKQEPEDEP